VLLHLHHVPGRLRLSLAGLKRNASGAAALREALLAIPGVTSTSASTPIGSVTIFYESGRLEMEQVWMALRDEGFLDCPRCAPRWAAQIQQERIAAAVADAIGRTVLSILLQRLLGPAGGSLVELLI